MEFIILYFVSNFVFKLNTFLKLCPDSHFSILFWLYLVGTSRPIQRLRVALVSRPILTSGKERKVTVLQRGLYCQVPIAMNCRRQRTQMPSLGDPQILKSILTYTLLLVLFVYIFNQLYVCALCIRSLSAGPRILLFYFSPPWQVPRALLSADRLPGHTICLLACLSKSPCSEILNCSVLSTCQVIPFLVSNFLR